MRKTRIKNKRRFTIAIIVFVLIIALVVCGILFLVKRLGATTGPLGDKDYETTGSAIEGSGGGGGSGSGNGSGNGQTTPGGQLTPEEIEAQQKELARKEAIKFAQEKINSSTYPIGTVEDFNLILINKTHALSKTYWPEDLVTIERHVKGVGNDDTHKLRKVAADALNEMLDAAAAEGLDIRLRTGFRSYQYQTDLYNSYVSRDGKTAADTYSARPGYSEHQTGLACDLGGATENFALSYKFGETKEGQWVAEHAHEYGFIIRFTDGKTDANGKRQPGQVTGYVFEPWHIRYVGKEHAEVMHQLNSKDGSSQITLEEYLGIVDEPQYRN